MTQPADDLPQPATKLDWWNQGSTQDPFTPNKRHHHQPTSDGGEKKRDNVWIKDPNRWSQGSI